MAEPATGQNPGKTPDPAAAPREDGLPTGVPFERGNHVGKLGGRPKGLARRVREAVEREGGDHNTLVTIMMQHATGYRQMLHPTETVDGEPVEVWQEVSANEQQAAIRWLADRGYGKALEFVPIETDEELVTGPDIPGLASDFERVIDELAEQRRKRLAAEQAVAEQQ